MSVMVEAQFSEMPYIHPLTGVPDLPTAGHPHVEADTKFMADGLCSALNPKTGRLFDPKMWDTNTREGHTAVRGRYVEIDGEKLPQAKVFEMATDICDECPVRELCLEFSLKYPEGSGLWGGLLPEERELLTEEPGAPAYN